MSGEPRVPRPFGRPVPPALVLWLTLVWVLLWGELSVGTVLGGLAAGVAVTWLLPLPALDPGIRLRPVAAARFLGWFLADLVASTARVVLWVARPGRPPVAFVRVPLRTSSEAMIMIVMVALATVPGSLVVEFQPARRELLLHVLGRTGDVAARTRDGVAALEARVVAAFGTRRDREELW